jgi:hypothetical protein
MDIDLRKTATDAAYIVVGAGVLGFQQAQVRRRELKAKLDALRTDAGGTLAGQADTLKAQADALKTQAGSLKAQADGLVAGITGTAASVGAQVRDQVTSQVGAATDVASTVDPRTWIDPVVGDLKARVEPMVEQVRGLTSSVSLPDSVPSLQSLPAQVSEQVGKAIQVGKARVQSVRGTTADPAGPTSA